MADNVKLEDMNEEQLRNIKDLGAKVANKEVENSKIRTILGMNQQAQAQAQAKAAQAVAEEEAVEEEASDEEAE